MTRIERIVALQDQYEDLEEGLAYADTRDERRRIARELDDVIARLHDLGQLGRVTGPARPGVPTCAGHLQPGFCGSAVGAGLLARARAAELKRARWPSAVNAARRAR